MHLRLKIVSILAIFMLIINIMPIYIYASEVKQEVKSGIENFPESYQEYLKELKELHPNWNFEAYYTGIEWSEFIENEMELHNRNVVPSSYSDVWKCSDCTSIKGWTGASKSAISFYADPRNFLNEIRIFQFEELSFNKNVHTLDSVEKSVQNTFLKNSVTYFDETENKNVTKKYSEIILEAASKNNISPFHIKSKIIQEVGSNGSASVSGTYQGYEGLYNFFNYGAYDEGDPIANGLEFARQKGWTNPYKAIMGGAELIGNSYIQVGQNTSYFFKFDVVGNQILNSGESATINTNSFYSHQYMTNVVDPYSQSSAVYNMYAANGNIDANLNFIIPVYNNMPKVNTRPTKYTSEDGELYYSITKAEAKESPVKSDKTVYVAEEHEAVLMVSRKDTLSDGTYWDVVKLENGSTVYIQSEQLESCTAENVSSNVQEDKAIIDEENMIIKTTPIATNNTIATLFEGKNFNIVDLNQKNTTDIATGYKLNIIKNDDSIEKTYTLIKVGDVNSDKRITASDYVLIKNLIMQSGSLEDIMKKAADVNDDGKVSATDYVIIKNHIMDNRPINIQ